MHKHFVCPICYGGFAWGCVDGSVLLSEYVGGKNIMHMILYFIQTHLVHKHKPQWIYVYNLCKFCDISGYDQRLLSLTDRESWQDWLPETAQPGVEIHMWSDLIWYDLMWSDLIWYDLMWSDVICILLLYIYLIYQWTTLTTN